MTDGSRRPPGELVGIRPRPASRRSIARSTRRIGAPWRGAAKPRLGLPGTPVRRPLGPCDGSEIDPAAAASGRDLERTAALGRALRSCPFAASITGRVRSRRPVDRRRAIAARHPSRGPGASLRPRGDPGALPSEGIALDSPGMRARARRSGSRAWPRLAGAFAGLARPTGGRGSGPPLSLVLRRAAGAPPRLRPSGPSDSSPGLEALTGQRRALRERAAPDHRARGAVSGPSRPRTALAAPAPRFSSPRPPSVSGGACGEVPGSLRWRAARRAPRRRGAIDVGLAGSRHRRSSTARNEDGRRSRWGSAARPRGERGAPTISPRRSP